MMPMPKCDSCEGSRKADGAPDAPLCKDCKCHGCTMVTGENLIRCATGGEMLCLACHNAETSDGCPVAKRDDSELTIEGRDQYGSLS